MRGWHLRITRRHGLALLFGLGSQFVLWRTLMASELGSAADALYLVSVDEGELTQRILLALQVAFPGSRSITAKQPGGSQSKAIYVAIGPEALRMLLQRHDVSGFVIATFIASYVYREIIHQVPRNPALMVTAIFAEPSPHDQVRLIAGLYRRRITVAVPLTDRTATQWPVIQQAAARHDLNVVALRVNDVRTLQQALGELPEASVLLVLPDNQLYTPDTLRHFLTAAYRRGQGVVGLSQSFVRAGALASTYSDVADTIAHLQELLAELRTSGRLAEPQYPRYFGVEINQRVARSLDLVVEDAVPALARRPSVR